MAGREPLLTATVRFSARRPGLIAACALAATLAALAYACSHFAMTTDTQALISAKVPWRLREAAMDRAFPGTVDTTLVVVDGRTPEAAAAAADRLTAALSAEPTLFRRVQQPEGGPFFSQEGLLFRRTDEVKSGIDGLIAAEPFLGPLAADASLRGVGTALQSLAEGVGQGRTSLAALTRPLSAFADAVDAVNAGGRPLFSWQALIGSDGGGLKAPLRRFILVQPVLDYGVLEPGASSTERVRADALRLGLTPDRGVRVRLTGAVPLSDEEFASLSDHAGLVGAAMGLSMLTMLWFAVRSLRIIAAILATTTAGLILTAAAGLAAVGRFNLISVAFIPLFVGLGVDFGIQLCVRFRAERLTIPDTVEALVSAARGVGGALTLAACAITLGFFAFAPTDYVGVSELGVIAGFGMVIALVLALTLLPALLRLLRLPPERRAVGNLKLEPLDRFLVKERRLVLWTFAASLAASVLTLPLVRFDFNPLHLKNPHGPAMSTLNDLLKDPLQSPQTLDVLEPSLPSAVAVARRLSALPQVSQAITLESFVPEDQAPKLALIKDAQSLLDPALNPFDLLPAPSDAEAAASLVATSAALKTAAGTAPGAGPAAARRLARGLATLAAAPPARRQIAATAFTTPLQVLLGQIRQLLSAGPVTLASLPQDLTRDWVSAKGQARIEVFPKGSALDNAALSRFSTAVRAAAPTASGGPISIQEAGRTVSHAFIEAGLLSLLVITLLLAAVLRSVREVAFTLAPVVLSGFLTLGSCVLIGQPINFANIIAFPLLFGVGVAFHIYFVMAWRSGARDLLQSSLAQAVFFSALTTGAAFASLMLSSHPGTASMGKILMIALFWTLVCALLFEPALLGPPRPESVTGEAGEGGPAGVEGGAGASSRRSTEPGPGASRPEELGGLDV